MFCRYCGTQLHDRAVICPSCGCPTSNNAAQQTTWNYSGLPCKSKVTALLLCWFLGCYGAHRFYLGHTGTAIVQLLTLGGCGIWAIVDFFIIVTNGMTDKYGRPLQ